ncbi:MAG: endo-1,4-beta-xylanase [Myxococcota bacterium]
MRKTLPRLLLATTLALGPLACSDEAEPVEPSEPPETVEEAQARLLEAARGACIASGEFAEQACFKNCSRFGETNAIESCEASCSETRTQETTNCETVADVSALACDEPSLCADAAEQCREAASTTFDGCATACGDDPLNLRCRIACDSTRAIEETACGFSTAVVVPGSIEIPALPQGRPADLGVLLDADEMATVDEADSRAPAFRAREVRLNVGRPGVEVRVAQLTHGFEFGFPVDFREFRDEPEDLAFYTEIARDHGTLMVAETALKWRQLEPEPGRLEFDLGDSELAWADENGFTVKMHTLLWGNAPPFSTGSGTPEWVRDLFPSNELSDADRQELTDLIRFQAEAVVERYRGRIDIYDVTNETLNPLTSWFADRLGGEIVEDLFRWVRAIDPGAQLVLNEWISEVFTGLESGATAALVRDRALDLIDKGVPIDAIGQQAHFAPVLLFAGGADLSNPELEPRTRVDDYADALATLSEAGLPIHITETTFNVPADPEERAAHAEAMMRVWWGTEAVEEIVFWSLWNKVAARNALQHGIFDDTRDGTLTRHGEAILSLINDRWRTNETATTNDEGAIELRATLGDYVAEWEEDGEVYSMRFRVERGPGVLTVVAVGE